MSLQIKSGIVIMVPRTGNPSVEGCRFRSITLNCCYLLNRFPQNNIPAVAGWIRGKYRVWADQNQGSGLTFHTHLLIRTVNPGVTPGLNAMNHNPSIMSTKEGSQIHNVCLLLVLWYHDGSWTLGEPV